MSTKQRYVVGITTALVILTVAYQEAWAIPAWARKYKTSCATCHEFFPKVNATGEAFRLNGYKFADDAAYIKEEPVVLGQETYKKMWPDAIWPADLPGLPPISLRVLSDYNIDTGGVAGGTGPQEARSTFDFPHEIEMIVAGAIGNQMSFYTEVEWEDADDVETGIEAWLQVEDIVGPENAINIRAGTLGISEFGLFNARDHNRLTKNRYLYGNWTLPYPSFTTQNDYRLRNMQPGVEVNGFGARWRYAVGVVNGNNGAVADNNSEKDLYAQLAIKIWGLGFDGSGGKVEEAAGAAGKGIWRDDSIIASLFYYTGTALVSSNGTRVNARDDDFWRFGPGVQYKWQDLTANAGVMFGSNDNPYGTVNTKEVDSTAWFIEGTYFVYPWLVPTARYETLSLDLPTLSGLQKDQDQTRLVIATKVLLRANVSLSLEGMFYTENEVRTKATPKVDKDNDDLVTIRLDVAF